MNQEVAPHDPFAPTAAARLWFGACAQVAAAVSVLGFSYRYEGIRNVPKSGPLLVLANHQSFLDPPMVALAFRRHLVFLARKTLFRNMFLGWLFRSLHGVPIDQQGVGKEGIRTVSEQLKMGKAVLVFPEGARSPNGLMQPLKPGIHLLIRKTRAPILPIGVAGPYDAFPVHQAIPSFAPLFLPARKGTCAVSIGKPFESDSLADMSRDDALQIISDRISEMQQRAEKIRRR
ncbi:MAG: 1-acyl-sn-glycerol-3-phosphate acyltransferase [Gemmataceae bacterium]|nr:1-acyl-sn-glycerol-3-phosphate acyltransferase [Gemmataceae bacterium]